MQTQLTERVIECVELIKETQQIPSTRKFSKMIEVHPQCISDIMTGKREANADLISKLVATFNVNANYLFSGHGSPLVSTDNNSNDNSSPIVTVVTTSEGNERIVHVPQAAHAGYVDQFNDPLFMQQLPSFSLPDPRFSRGTYRCFDVCGDSMEPTLYTGDKVICSYVEPEYWMTAIKNNYVYVLITDSGIIVKRVLNRLKESQELLLLSDNNYYDPYTLQAESLKEVWVLTQKISPFLPSPNNIRNALHTEIDHLRTTIADQGRLIMSLNKTIEKMLKQNRQVSARF